MALCVATALVRIARLLTAFQTGHRPTASGHSCIRNINLGLLTELPFLEWEYLGEDCSRSQKSDPRDARVWNGRWTDRQALGLGRLRFRRRRRRWSGWTCHSEDGWCKSREWEKAWTGRAEALIGGPSIIQVMYHHEAVGASNRDTERG